MKIYRLNHTRFYYEVSRGSVRFIQFGKAPEGEEVGDVIAGALALYDANFQDDHDDPDFVVSGSGNDPDTDFEIDVRKGMSGCIDHYLVRSWHEFYKGFFVPRKKTDIILHLSMYGRLNKGITVNRSNRVGFSMAFPEFEGEFEGRFDSSSFEEIQLSGTYLVCEDEDGREWKFSIHPSGEEVWMKHPNDENFYCLHDGFISDIPQEVADFIHEKIPHFVVEFNERAIIRKTEKTFLKIGCQGVVITPDAICVNGGIHHSGDIGYVNGLREYEEQAREVLEKNGWFLANVEGGNYQIFSAEEKPEND